MAKGVDNETREILLLRTHQEKPAEGYSSYSAGSEQEKGQPTFDVEK